MPLHLFNTATMRACLLLVMLYGFYVPCTLSFSTSTSTSLFLRDQPSPVAISYSPARPSLSYHYRRLGISSALSASSSEGPSTTGSTDTSPSESTPGSTSSTDNISLIFQCITFIRLIADNVLPRAMKASQRHGMSGLRRKRGLRLVESAAFKGLSEWAFSVCDSEGDGRIQREELYSGILLVHLHLAKYVGVAACQPLNRTQVDELFEMAASHNNAKTIGQREFEDIVVYSCAHIGSRIGVYYSMLLVLAPFLTGRLLRSVRYFKNVLGVHLHRRGQFGPWFESLWIMGEWLIEHAVSVSVFVLAVPWVFSKIDPYTRRLIKPRKKPNTIFWWEKVQDVQKQLLNATSVDDMKEIFINATAAKDANATTVEANEDADDATEKLTQS
jgi:hypothetical protein